MTSMTPAHRYGADTLRMAELCAEAWRLQSLTRSEHSEVVPEESGPILFFGNLAAYRTSPLRVVTVGLNPSNAEFPTDTPWLRFPKLDDPDSYVASLSAYFGPHAYRRWFNSYEPVLNGLEASYYAGDNIALHTDLCTPVPTSPTWSRLSTRIKADLQSDGRALWDRLIAELAPHVVIASVAYKHLMSLGLAEPWKALHVIERANPYVTEGARMKLADSTGSTLIVRAKAAQVPFGLASKADKILIGKTVRSAL